MNQPSLAHLLQNEDTDSLGSYDDETGEQMILAHKFSNHEEEAKQREKEENEKKAKADA